MDCSLPGFSVHGIFQTRVLEWVATAFSTRPCRTNTKKKKKDVIFIIQDWIAKLENPEIAGVMGKFAFGVQNEAG